MKVVLKGGGIEDILGNLSKSIENPILVKDHHFEECIHIGEESDPLYKVLVEDINQSLKKSKSSFKSNKSSKDQVIISGQTVDRLMVPIIVRNNIYGHLITYGTWRELTNFDVLSLESSSNVIAMEFLKRISVQEVENKYKAEFFEDLISLDAKRKEKALERANYYRFDRDGHYSILTVLFEDEEGQTQDEGAYSQALIKAMYMIDLACRDGARTYLMANKGRKIHILFMWKSRDEHGKNAGQAAATIDEILNTKMNTLKFRIGIGRVYKGLENTYKSLRDAEKAVEASVNYVDDKIIDFEELGIYKIFCQDHLKEELVSFYEATLKPLVLYDRKRDTELVKSLIIYFETNGNLKKMSEKLFTHYNTVLYRINRIQEITGKSLDNEGERYGLQTALKIMKILDL
jgi:purine catabolism regulator